MGGVRYGNEEQAQNMAAEPRTLVRTNRGRDVISASDNSVVQASKPGMDVNCRGSAKSCGEITEEELDCQGKTDLHSAMPSL